LNAATTGANQGIEPIAMHTPATPHTSALPRSISKCVTIFSSGLFAATLLTCVSTLAPAAAQTSATAAAPHASTAKPHRHHSAKKKPAPVPVAQTPPPPPMPHWPINDSPNPPSVVWNASGLQISASNSSLQQILNEVSTDTGTKVVGPVPDQRVYGNYGPGDAREVLSQLLQGSGYNILLAGDIGKGAPSEIVLSPRRSGPANAPNSMNRAQPGDPDEEGSDQSDEEPQPQVQQPQMPNEIRPGFGPNGPNGPMRTPQQVMEEMQQRQQLQQQQMQQQLQQQQMQQQQQNPQQ